MRYLSIFTFHWVVALCGVFAVPACDGSDPTSQAAAGSGAKAGAAAQDDEALAGAGGQTQAADGESQTMKPATGGEAGASDERPEGSGAGEGGGHATGAGGDAAGASAGEPENCNDLVVGELEVGVGVVERDPPAPEGGAALLSGTYDLEQASLHIRDGIDASAAEDCRAAAASRAQKVVGLRESIRFTSAGGGHFSYDTVRTVAGVGVARASTSVVLTNDVYLDVMNGTSQCLYSKTADGENLTHETYTRGPGFLGYDYVATFTSSTDSVAIISGQVFPESGPAYCSWVEVYRRR
jgi:hypothetical protein